MVVTIIEGGELSYTLARILLLFNHNINIIRQESEAYLNKFNELGVNIVLGTGIDVDILSKPCISESDVIIALMDSDADNFAACLFVKENYSNNKTITKVNNPKYIKKFEQLGIDISFNSAFVDLSPINLNEDKK